MDLGHSVGGDQGAEARAMERLLIVQHPWVYRVSQQWGHAAEGAGLESCMVFVFCPECSGRHQRKGLYDYGHI